MLATLTFVLLNVALHLGGPKQKPELTLAALGDLNVPKDTGRAASWWLSNAYLSKESTPDVVLFGSSQLGGLQAADANLLKTPQDYVLNHESITVEGQLKRHNIDADCFAIGMVGSMISDHYMISKVLFSSLNKPKLMVVTVSPRDFIDGCLPSVTATEVFTFFSPYLNSSMIGDEFLCTPIEKMIWFATSGLPIRSLFRNGPGESETKELTLEKNEKPMQRLTQDPLLTTNTVSMSNIRRGQCIVLPNMPEFFVDNSRDYKKRYCNSRGPMYQRQLTCFSNLLANAKERGIKVLVVGMPLDASNSSLLPESFWSDYRNRLQSACTIHGASFMELSHDAGFRRSDFVDGVHLSALGGWKLSSKIADAIAAAPHLVAALKANSETQLATVSTTK